MDGKRSYYAVIPAKVRYDENLSANAKLLYGEITALSNETGYCWASNDYFAKLYGVTKRAIQKWLKGLENAGYISVECGETNGNKTRLIKISAGVYTPANKSSRPMNESSQPVNKSSRPMNESSPPVNKSSRPHEQKFTQNNTSNINKYTSQIFDEAKIDDSTVRDRTGQFAHENNLQKETSKACDKAPAADLDEENFNSASARHVPPRPRGKRTFAPDSDPYLLARFLERHIQRNCPGFAEDEARRQRWAYDMDLMIRRDNLNPDDIAKVIEWAQNDGFWRGNILSGKKLREKYQQLEMKMQKERG